MVEAWESGDYVTYPQLPGWPGPPWSLLLIPGWRELAGQPVAEIAVEQWLATTRVLLEDLEELPPERWCVADHAALAADPSSEVARICAFLELEAPDRLDGAGRRGEPRGDPELARRDRANGAAPGDPPADHGPRRARPRPARRPGLAAPDADPGCRVPAAKRLHRQRLARPRGARRLPAHQHRGHRQPDLRSPRRRARQHALPRARPADRDRRRRRPDRGRHPRRGPQLPRSTLGRRGRQRGHRERCALPPPRPPLHRRHRRARARLCRR